MRYTALIAALTAGFSLCAFVVTVEPARAALQDLGHAAPATSIPLAITLNYRHADQLEQLIRLQNDPSSPYFHHWLTSEQFAQAFGPTPEQYARVAATLRRAGLAVTRTYTNRTVVDAEGPVANVERLFATRIDRIVQPGYGLRYANVRPATTPFELRDEIFAVSGLNDLAIVHAGATQTPGLYGPRTNPSGYVGYGPLAFERAYDFPGIHASGKGFYDGTGRTSAIVIDADYLDSDIAGYLRYFKIKHTGKIARVSVDSGVRINRLGANSDAVEATLDVEAIAGSAPGADLYVYEIPPFILGDFVVTDGYNQVVSDNKVDTVNSSFAACETADVPTFKAWDHVAMQGVALGITFHASSGDLGSVECGGTSPSVGAPADSPHFVAVGGTALTITSDGGYKSEVGWNQGGASGGGVSVEFPLPSWQKGVKNVIPSGRNVPDVAFDASPATGEAFFFKGTWKNSDNPIGGTSLASPLFGAALTEVDEVLGGRSGMAAASFFALLKKDGYGSAQAPLFHDVTSGFNFYYYCSTGYDNMTGIGSLDVWNIAQALKK